MKIKLHKNLRIALMVLCSIVICVLLYLIYVETSHTEYQEEKRILYSYNHKSNISYEAFLKPNILYDTDRLGEDQIYFTEYTDYIQVAFQYEFAGGRASDIEASYRISAMVEGYTGSDKVQTIWQKEFPLVHETKMNTHDKSLSIIKDLPVQLNTYNEFSKMVAETSKVSSQSNLSVVMYINIKVKTDTGNIVEDLFQPMLVIPLNTNYFVISKNVPPEKPGTIENTEKIRIQADLNKVILYSIIIVLSIAGLIFLIFFTINLPVKSQLEISLSKIFREHGSRFVALESEIIKEYGDYIKVHAIDDLVRISDELEKPILYNYTGNYDDIHLFFILDGPVMYVFNLQESISSFSGNAAVNVTKS